MISVLCVDDDALYLSLEKRCLEEPGALTVTTVFSAPEALRVMETNQFDTIVSDYQMPGMDGIALLKAVRAANPGLPFIIFTGRGREELVIEAFNDGVDFYLQKDGDPEVMFARLKDTIKKAVKLGTVWKTFHDSEARYRRLFETAREGILLLDAESGTITDTNPFLLNLLGYTREELLGKKLWDLKVIRDKGLSEQAADLLKEEGYLRYYDMPLETKDGRVIDVEFVCNTYRVDNEQVIQCDIRDLTDRKRMEADQKRASEEHFDLYYHAPCGYHSLDRNGIFVTINDMELTWLGFLPEEIIGRKKFSDFLTEKSRDKFNRHFPLFSENAWIDDPELEIIRKDGTILTVLASATAIRDPDGIVIMSRSTLHDITARKRADQAREKSGIRYRRILDLLNEGIWSFDKDAITTFVNPCMAEMLGYSPDEMQGRSLFSFMDEQAKKIASEKVERRQRGSKEKHGFEFLHRGGSRIYTVINLVPLTDNAGNYTGAVASVQDITEQKSADENMQIFAEDLERRVSERTSDLTDFNLNLMTEIEIRLKAEKQLMKNVGEKEVLLREVHHRVKNNLQIIISLLNLQSRYITDEATLAAFKESQNRVRAMALVHEKLYRSNDLATIDLNNYIRFLSDSLFRFFGINKTGITLNLEIHDIFLAIDTAIPFGLMINELISNSLKYAFPGGRTGEISIAVTRQDHQLTILFKDNGAGIPENVDWRNARSLGLRLVITLVEQLDGTIELDRRSGTAFTIVVKEKE